MFSPGETGNPISIINFAILFTPETSEPPKTETLLAHHYHIPFRYKPDIIYVSVNVFIRRDGESHSEYKLCNNCTQNVLLVLLNFQI